MGYTTSFVGQFEFDKNLDRELFDYINIFSHKRHMKRDVDKIKEMDVKWKSRSYKGDLGKDGQYYLQPNTMKAKYIAHHFWRDIDKYGEDTNITEYSGQLHDISVIDYNTPPDGVPGLWCDWVVKEENGKHVLKWNGSEKFYHYISWLRYLIDNFIKPNGYQLNGHIRWYGENKDDKGIIFIAENEIFSARINEEDDGK